MTWPAAWSDSRVYRIEIFTSCLHGISHFLITPLYDLVVNWSKYVDLSGFQPACHDDSLWRGCFAKTTGLPFETEECIDLLLSSYGLRATTRCMAGSFINPPHIISLICLEGK